jgi:hypothetical protein
MSAEQVDDPRVEVLMQADLMAAPVGTVIPKGDNSWRDYAVGLLAKLDEVDPLRQTPIATPYTEQETTNAADA